MLDLCNKYRPKHLADVYGQAFTTSFLKSVVNKPQESPRYFLLTGTSGVGKSTISRAFARDLIESTTGTKVDDILNHPNYIEIDSSEKAIQDNFDKVKDLVFSEINGYKVVLLDECLSYHATVRVRLSTGEITRMRIGKLVTNRIPCDVLSFDGENYVWKPITGYHKNSLKPMYKYIFKSKGRKYEVTATSNHLFYVKGEGYVAGENLFEGMVVQTLKHNPITTQTARETYSYRKYQPKSMTRTVVDDEEAVQVVLGTLLGDSYIGYAHDKCKNMRLRFEQSIKQDFYFREKERILEPLVSNTFNAVNYGFYCPGDGYPDRVVLQAYTINHEWFNQFKPLISSGHRVPTREFLNRLTPLAIAVWFMDDGSFSGWIFKDGKRAKVSPNAKGAFNLATNSFGKEGNEEIIKYFKEVWGIEFKLKFEKRCSEGNQYSLTTPADAENNKKFAELISPYILKEFQYKLGWYAEAGDEFRSVKALKVIETPKEERVHKPKRYFRAARPTFEISDAEYVGCYPTSYRYGEKYTYDISVEDTHCYFANDVLVHNCHLLPKPTTQQLLKVLEDFVGRIFIFLATTEKQDLFGPLVSRMMQFELNTPSQDQCVDYAQQILELEAKNNPSLPSVSQQALQVAALNARSNLRTMLKQVEVILFQGEEKYLENYSSIWKSIEDYFFNFSSTDTDIIEGMYKYHPVQLRGFITAYFRDEILNPKASRYNQVYPEPILPKLFASYLKLISYVTSPDDFFSFLYMFRTMLKKLAQVPRGA